MNDGLVAKNSHSKNTHAVPATSTTASARRAPSVPVLLSFPVIAGQKLILSVGLFLGGRVYGTARG